MTYKATAILLAAVFFGSHSQASDGTKHLRSFASMFVRKYDANHDGKLNGDEYPDRYRKYFGTSDANGDGYVDVAEVSTQMEKLRDRWRERMQERKTEYRNRHAQRAVTRAFERDANGDGKLNADEASDIVTKEFGEIDADGDGYVSRSELETALGIKSQLEENIVETAQSAGTFQTLVKAAVAAGLGDVLQSPGPFTVLAPTDEAFAKLPEGALNALINDKEKLASVLKYHVIAGNVLAKDVVKLSKAKTVQGGSVAISVSDSGVRINNAKVLKTDIRCSNGVIHVIDTVLMPECSQECPAEKRSVVEKKKSIVQTAIDAGSFNTLVQAVKAAGLADALSGNENLTVFAPTDKAFAKIPKEDLAALLADKEKLKAVLTYHVVPGRLLAKAVVERSNAKSLQGQEIGIAVTGKGVKVNNANVLKTDILCSNGVIHVIDSVLIPNFDSASKVDQRRLFQFGGDDIRNEWKTVNDGVMGGVSKGSVRFTDTETLEFYGELSLRNNGGFASTRSMSKKLELTDGDTVVIRARGDGRQYYLNLYVPTLRIAFSYRAPIQTEAGKWVEIRVPVRDFYATSFGRRVESSTLKPSQVNSVGFMLADKKAGPFRLEVESIQVTKSN